jgi:hypothetical protein
MPNILRRRDCELLLCMQQVPQHQLVTTETRMLLRKSRCASDHAALGPYGSTSAQTAQPTKATVVSASSHSEMKNDLLQTIFCSHYEVRLRILVTQVGRSLLQVAFNSHKWKAIDDPAMGSCFRN